MAESNQLWGLAIIDALCAQGVDTFVVSPGSRSTPLVLALSLRNITPVVHIDERAAAFYALGVGKATGKPAALICTSGSAVANYLPAVVEASESYVPLLVVSADRPPELWDCQANQAINQRGIFGDYVRHETQLPTPSEDMPHGFVGSSVSYAVGAALGVTGSPGPAHINCSFREPFIESHLLTTSDVPAAADISSGVVRIQSSPKTPEFGDVLPLFEKASGAIVVGQMSNNEPDAPQAILELAKHLQWPVLPDVSSGLRFSQAAEVINFADQCLLESMERPDLVLWFGGPVVSKRLNTWMAKGKSSSQLIRVSPIGERIDPWHVASHHIVADIALTANALQQSLSTDAVEPSVALWATRNACVSSSLAEALSTDNVNEACVVRQVIQAVPQGWTLFLGNSMPIRDADMFGPVLEEAPVVDVNRGASGIDGNIATVAGIAAGSQTGVVAVIGDLTALHDLTSLDLVRRGEHPIKLVIINNDGGGIFSFLPLAKTVEQSEDQSLASDFEAMWNTPHGMTFESAAKQFGLSYESVTSLDGLAGALDSNNSAVIEVQINRSHNVDQHGEIQRKVLAALQSLNNTEVST